MATPATDTAPPADGSLTDAVEKVDLNDDDKKEEPKESSSNDEDAMDENSTDTDDDGSDDEPIEAGKADDRLLEAMKLKEEGNEFFKKGDLEKAARSYRKGCSRIKPLNKNNTGDEQVKALLIVLQTNLSMVCFKQSKYRMSVDVATRAIAIDPAHVKALYRRAVGHRQLGNLDKARDDLREALKTEPTNTACKKELIAIKKAVDAANATQKKSLAKAFSSSSSFLYDDKVIDEKKRQEEALKRKKEQEELQKKRKAEWEDECVKRMANNEGAISFEEWEKEQEEQKKKAHEEEERKKKEAEKKRKEERKKQKKEMKETEKDDSDDELTEQELAMMRGYKKTADGRTTSYFTRELSEEEKKVVGSTAPKRLDEQPSNSPTAIASSLVDQSGTSHSAWNQAGTWEEKDTTIWCTSQLRKRLEEVTVTSKVDADIVEVDELVGDASVAMAGGKKRYIFDFHAKLTYEIKDPNDSDAAVAKGTVRLPDICSTSHEELEVSFGSWTKRPAPDLESEAVEVRKALATQVRAAVQQWVQDFNGMY